MADMETGKRIMQNAHDLFMQYGLRSVSMDDIAQNLGISKKTIYQYFKDKDQLIVEIVGSAIKCRQILCENNRIASVNAIHEIFLAMDVAVELFRTMNPALIFDMHKYYPKAFKLFSDHKYHYLYNVFYENIKRGIKEDLYRMDVNPEIIARYRIESMMLQFNPEFYTKVKSTIAEIEEDLIIHYLFGLASMKGYKFILKYQNERQKLNKDAYAQIQ